MSETTYETLMREPKLRVVKLKANVSGQLQNCCFRMVEVKTNGENLLSRTVTTRLGLVKHIDEVNIFSGLGTLKGETVKITLKEGTQLYSIAMPRHVPIPLLPRVEEQLKRIESMGIIEKVTDSTEWCTPMVPVTKKNGKVRICVDL